MTTASRALVLGLTLLQGALGYAALAAHASETPRSSRPPARQGEARTRSTPSEEVTVLAPAVRAATSEPTPVIAELPGESELTPWQGLALEKLDMVVDPSHMPSNTALPSLEISSLRPGDRVTPARLREVIAEALATGVFASARLELANEGAGVHAWLHLVPRFVIQSIRIRVHNAPIESNELLRDAELTEGDEIVLSDIPRHRARIEAALQRHGFPSPTVEIKLRTASDPRTVDVDVDVIAGAPRRIERRVMYRFGGTQEALDDAESRYAVKAGAFADEAALDAADAELQARLRGRGWHRAEVSHDMVVHRGIIALRMRLDFGPHFETRYEGNEHYDKSTLDSALDLETETDRTPPHLVQKVREYYIKHGFLDAEVRLETRGTSRDATQFLVFHVVERQPVLVTSRSYPCLREADVRKLRNGGPTSAADIGREIDSFLEEELPGNALIVAPNAASLDRSIAGPGRTKRDSPTPLELTPGSVYAPDTYERAAQHVQELYRAEGFLAAQVGPVQVVRRTCDPRSSPGECVPLRTSAKASDECTYDAAGMPLPVAPLEPALTCTPDGDATRAATRGVVCETQLGVRIPVKLGPRTELWDLAFTGVRSLSPKELGKIAELKLGSWVRTATLEDARRRVENAYKEEGYAFVDVRYALELSPDRTRARVRFQVTEGEQVHVRRIEVRGNTFTKTSTIERRIALEVGAPYRTSLVRKTEERIATLGVFASIEVVLENPYVPQRNKVVRVTVVEKPRQYTEIAPGFSTGEGFRLATEYGHRNLAGRAIQLTLRLQFAYLPTPLILDPTARDNYRDLSTLARLGTRVTGSLVFPDVGLGPLIRTGLDGLVVHDLQRDFFITKLAVIPNVSWRPANEFQVTLFNSFEFNSSRIFQAGSIDAYLTSLRQQGVSTTNLQRVLLVPDRSTYAIAQRILASWDRRDNAFNAARGTYVVSGIEHVDAFPTDDNLAEARANREPEPPSSHFFRLTQTFGGYLPLPKGMRFAALTRLGANVQVTPTSATYPDRLFFMGGVDSMRGWNVNSFIPQDDIDRIFRDRDLPDTVPDLTQVHVNGQPLIANPAKFTAATKPIRGGNLMINERLEWRIPIRGPFETVVFGDFGNLWSDAAYPFQKGVFPIRAAAGTGLRVQTPVGPIAVDYGFNLTREAYEDVGALNFAIGLF